MSVLNFKQTSYHGNARTGILTTLHNSFETPAFVPVATTASIRTVDDINEIKKLGIKILMCNTFHLAFNENITSSLHDYMDWKGSLMTDSGGFQVFSMGFGREHNISKIGYSHAEPKPAGEKQAFVNDDGVIFKDNNGVERFLTPEKSIDIQHKLGADIIFAFDECTSPLHDHEYTSKSLERTHDWAKKCLESHNTKQALYGIIQGGIFRDLREKSAAFVTSLPFDGFGIGGSFGCNKADVNDVLDWIYKFLPENKPRHMLGIGDITNVFEAIERGIDTFDCVIPTRNARHHGSVMIKEDDAYSYVHIGNQKFLNDDKILNKDCVCTACSKGISRAKIRQLFKERNPLAGSLATLHNLSMMESLFKDIRNAIKEQSFHELKKACIENPSEVNRRTRRMNAVAEKIDLALDS